MKNIQRVQVCSGFEHISTLNMDTLYNKVYDTFMFDPEFKLTGANYVIPCKGDIPSDPPNYEVIPTKYFSDNFIHSWPTKHSKPTHLLDTGVVTIHDFYTLLGRLKPVFGNNGRDDITYFPKMAKFIYSLMGKGVFYLVLDLEEWTFDQLYTKGFFTKYFHKMDTHAYKNINTNSEMILVSLERPKVKSLNHHLAIDPESNYPNLSSLSPTGNCQIQAAYPGYWRDRIIKRGCMNLTEKPLLLGVVQSRNEVSTQVFASVTLPDNRKVVIARKEEIN